VPAILVDRTRAGDRADYDKEKEVTQSTYQDAIATLSRLRRRNGCVMLLIAASVLTGCKGFTPVDKMSDADKAAFYEMQMGSY